jgi:hypothetical protein
MHPNAPSIRMAPDVVRSTKPFEVARAVEGPVSPKVGGSFLKVTCKPHTKPLYSKNVFELIFCYGGTSKWYTLGHGGSSKRL